MGKTSKLHIVETSEELFKIKKQQTNLRSEKRIECLLLLKQAKFSTQETTAQYLGISRQTLVRWLSSYTQGGISGILPKRVKNRKSQIFTPELHKGLEDKMSDPTPLCWAIGMLKTGYLKIMGFK